jgi:hypothetical protein
MELWKTAKSVAVGGYITTSARALTTHSDFGSTRYFISRAGFAQSPEPSFFLPVPTRKMSHDFRRA